MQGVQAGGVAVVRAQSTGSVNWRLSQLPAAPLYPVALAPLRALAAGREPTPNPAR